MSMKTIFNRFVLAGVASALVPAAAALAKGSPLAEKSAKAVCSFPMKDTTMSHSAEIVYCGDIWKKSEFAECTNSLKVMTGTTLDYEGGYILTAVSGGQARFTGVSSERMPNPPSVTLVRPIGEPPATVEATLLIADVSTAGTCVIDKLVEDEDQDQDQDQDQEQE